MTIFCVCGVLVLAFAFVAVIFAEHEVLDRHLFEFENRFPPITDEEFLALCGPGTDPEVALGVRRIVSEKLCIEYERVHPSANFIDDLGAD